MARQFRIVVKGIDPYRRGLEKFARGISDVIHEADVEVAGRIIVPAAKRNASGLRHPNLAGGTTSPGSEVVGSIKAKRSKPVAVEFGKGVEHAAGHEFGSLAFRQFPSWTGSAEDAGYFMWPAIRDTRDKAIEVYRKAMSDASKGAFPD